MIEIPAPRGERAIVGRIAQATQALIARFPWVTRFALVWVALLAVCAAFGPWIVPHDPFTPVIALRNMPPGSSVDGGFPFLLGTDSLGRDLLSRLIIGARVSLVVGLASVVISGVFGTIVGMVAGYFRGRVESVIMRLIDLQMSLPSLLIALLVLFVLGPSFVNVVLVLAISRWMIYARVTRAMTISLREQPFVEAARSLGGSDLRILVRHILPSVRTPLLVIATLELPIVLLTEASLSFLGLGLQPPETSWGLMLAEGRTYMRSAWWIVTFSGVALLLAALSFNLLGGWFSRKGSAAARADALAGSTPASAQKG